MRLRRERDLAKTKTKIIVPGHGGAPRLQPKRRQSRDRFLPLSHFCRSTRPSAAVGTILSASLSWLWTAIGETSLWPSTNNSQLGQRVIFADWDRERLKSIIWYHTSKVTVTEKTLNSFTTRCFMKIPKTSGQKSQFRKLSSVVKLLNDVKKKEKPE